MFHSARSFDPPDQRGNFEKVDKKIIARRFVLVRVDEAAIGDGGADALTDSWQRRGASKTSFTEGKRPMRLAKKSIAISPRRRMMKRCKTVSCSSILAKAQCVSPAT